MKRALRTALLLALVIGLAYWALSLRENAHPPAWLAEHLREARSVYAGHPLLVVAVFCATHVLCATFGVPGSCTALNIASGAVFGFWRGCAIVYPATMVSACLGYLAAAWLREKHFFRKYSDKLSGLRAGTAKGGFLFLVSLRLNPFLPYGVINPGLGLLHVPFGAFLASTFVGIFFDVVLLNSVGAALAAAGEAPTIDSRLLLASFLALAGLAAGIRFVASKFTSGGDR